MAFSAIVISTRIEKDLVFANRIEICFEGRLLMLLTEGAMGDKSEVSARDSYIFVGQDREQDVTARNQLPTDDTTLTIPGPGGLYMTTCSLETPPPPLYTSGLTGSALDQLLRVKVELTCPPPLILYFFDILFAFYCTWAAVGDIPQPTKWSTPGLSELEGTFSTLIVARRESAFVTSIAPHYSREVIVMMLVGLLRGGFPEAYSFSALICPAGLKTAMPPGEV